MLRYCDVAIPDTRLDALTYHYDAASMPDLAAGDCVRVRLRGKPVFGIVTGLRASSPVRKTLPVEEVAEPRLLGADLVRLLTWTAAYYFGLPGELLHLVLPRGVCGRHRRPEAPVVAAVRECAHIAGPLPAELESAVADRRFGVWVAAGGQGGAGTIARFIAEAARRGSIIVQVPRHLTAGWTARLAAELGFEPLSYHAGLTPAQRRRTWRALRAGERQVVIGVRSVVFAPVADLAGVVVIDEHEPVYKEERRPRYHARDVAIVRARDNHCPVLLSDATPSAETWLNVSSGSYRWLARPEPLPPGRRVHVVDMRRHPGEVLAAMTVNEIGRARSAGGVAVLYINRRGLSRHVACRDCGHVFTCPECGVALVLDAAGTMGCRYCGRAEPAPDLCPACRGRDFSYRAPGTEMVAREVRRRFPEMPVRTLVGEAAGGVSFDPGSAVVGTRALLGVEWPARVTVVVALSVDADLSRPDFRSAERVFQVLSDLARRSRAAEASLVVQTYRPDEPAIRCGVDNDAGAFMQGELRLRKELGFPPFRRLALLEVSGRSRPAVATRAAALSRLLERNRDMQVLGPIAVPGRIPAERLLVKLPRGRRLDGLLARRDLDSPGVEVKVEVDPLDVV